MNFDSTRVKIDLDVIARNFDAVNEKVQVPICIMKSMLKEK